MIRTPRTLVYCVAVVCGGMFLGGCQNKLKAENSQLWDENKNLRGDLDSKRAALDALSAENANLQQQLADSQRSTATGGSGGSGGNLSGLAGDGVEVTQVGRNTVVSVAGDVLFDSGKADLKSSARAKLSQIAAAVRNDGGRLSIEGHTDSDPIRKSKWASNYALSEARATAVRDHLASQGVDRGRMSIVGHGPDNPKVPNSSSANKSQNRRVEIIVLR